MLIVLLFYRYSSFNFCVHVPTLFGHLAEIVHNDETRIVRRFLRSMEVSSFLESLQLVGTPKEIVDTCNAIVALGIDRFAVNRQRLHLMVFRNNHTHGTADTLATHRGYLTEQIQHDAATQRREGNLVFKRRDIEYVAIGHFALGQGSTDTTFYILAVYFGSVGVAKMRHAVTCGLLADLAGIIAAIAIAYMFFG